MDFVAYSLSKKSTAKTKAISCDLFSHAALNIVEFFMKKGSKWTWHKQNVSGSHYLLKSLNIFPRSQPFWLQTGKVLKSESGRS